MTENASEDELESIISLSSAPLENLSLALNNIEEHVSFFKKTPALAKPFLKRDIPTISNLEEQEWLDLLNKIKENLKSINITASNMLGKSPSFPPEHELMRSHAKKIPKRNLASIQSPRKKEAKLPSYDILPPQEKKVLETATIYCPECGHKCNGKKGLKVHIFKVHNDIRMEMLKTFEL